MHIYIHMCVYIFIGVHSAHVRNHYGSSALFFTSAMGVRCRGRTDTGVACQRKPASARAKYCKRCFKWAAAVSGCRGGGVQGNRGNRKATGVQGNSGNGKATGVQGNKGNSNAKAAGKRSWLKRHASDVLIIKAQWLELILDKKKTWEIRGSSTRKRGAIHLARSGSGGMIYGTAELADCRCLTRKELASTTERHCITDISSVGYAKAFAWVLQKVRRHKKPLTYPHRQGAVIWAKAHRWTPRGDAQ